MKKTDYKAVFISDTHLGFKFSKSKHLLNFLKTFDTDILYLPGDIFDFWDMKSWNPICNDVLIKFLKFKKVILTPGNHDEQLRHFIPLGLGGIEIVNHSIHTTMLGKRYLVIHGDQFDLVIGKMKWLSKFGHQLYDILLVLNHYFNWCREKMGLPYWSLAAYLKKQAKEAVSMIENFEELAAEYAKRLNCEGVICGHIHTPIFKMINDIEYYNCGDWVESCTALVEHMDGRLELIYWHV